MKIPLFPTLVGAAIAVSAPSLTASIAWAPIGTADGSWDLYGAGSTATVMSFPAPNGPATGYDQLTIDGATYRPVTMSIMADQDIEILDVGGVTGTYDRFFTWRLADELAAGDSVTVMYSLDEVLRRPRSSFHRPAWSAVSLPNDASVTMGANYLINGGGSGPLNLNATNTAGGYTVSDTAFPSLYDTQTWTGNDYTITPSLVAGEDYALTYTYDDPVLGTPNHISPNDPFPGSANATSGAPDWGISKYSYTIAAGATPIAAGTVFGFTVDGTLIPEDQLIAIPEPSRAILMGCALAALALRRRRIR